MGDLRDQLKKAKLLSDKEARRIAHEQRVHRTEVGREGVADEQAARARELASLQAAERERTRAQQAELDAQRQATTERAACVDLLQREGVRAGGGGSRWYFSLADGRLPWLEVTENQRRLLGAGALCVVRLPGEGPHGYGFLPTDHARRIARTLPDAVVWAVRGVLPR